MREIHGYLTLVGVRLESVRVDSSGVDARSTSYFGLYGKAPPERGIFFRPQVYERVGISLVEVYKRVGKSVILDVKITEGNRCFFWL